MDKTEYEMLREEILFYIDKNQAVRNMMFVVTIAYIGLIAENRVACAYFYLLPIGIIIPTFIISYDYLDNVYRAATYLKVFYEAEGGKYHWETRIRKFNDATNRGIKIHRLPYECATIMCLFFYFINDQGSINMRIYIIVGCMFIYFTIFWKYRKINEKSYIKNWEKIKENEMS